MTGRPIAIVPARGGSKGIARKNVIPFDGKPMLAWSLVAALESDVFERVYVTTDDEEIADVASSYAVEVLHRPKELATDASTLAQVLRHTIDEIPCPEHICMLGANAPLRNAADISDSYDLFAASGAEASISVSSFGPTPPFRAIAKQEQWYSVLFSEYYRDKRQEFVEAYCPSGAIYWTRPETIRSNSNLYCPRLDVFVMPWYRAIDIDELEDLEIALCISAGVRAGFQFSS